MAVAEQQHTADRARVPELEDWFDANSIAWRYVEHFELSKVDVAASLSNQARLAPLDERTVEKYAADYAADDVFPALVLYQHGRRVLAAGGNHRIAGANAADRPTHPAYVLTGIDEHTVHLVAIEDNRRHGLPFTSEERMFHAVHLVNGGRHSRGDAARICGVPASSLTAQLTANEGTTRAIDLDVFGWTALTTSTKARLQAITDDALFARAAAMVGRGEILQREVSELVGRLNNAATDRAKDILDSLEREATERTRRTRGHPPSALRAPRARLLSDLDGILNYQADHVAGDCQTPQQRAQLSDQIKAASRRLMAIDKELWR